MMARLRIAVLLVAALGPAECGGKTEVPKRLGGLWTQADERRKSALDRLVETDPIRLQKGPNLLNGCDTAQWFALLTCPCLFSHCIWINAGAGQNKYFWPVGSIWMLASLVLTADLCAR
jgi:hypothetical protein